MYHKPWSLSSEGKLLIVGKEGRSTGILIFYAESILSEIFYLSFPFSSATETNEISSTGILRSHV
jgi:hypothetical protein